MCVTHKNSAATEMKSNTILPEIRQVGNSYPNWQLLSDVGALLFSRHVKANFGHENCTSWHKHLWPKEKLCDINVSSSAPSKMVLANEHGVGQDVNQDAFPYRYLYFLVKN